ncbi:hypothetical protein [Streptomyces spectabilis]|uniref:hypothetical protein n=1 Tax=Streptomyces spectabilis TaxID=68270 RepID=UPI001CEF66C9|nr:hypothetical protein [Streptomyces spectabilis]
MTGTSSASRRVCARQPTRQQILDHQESTRLQFALVERAAALGWEGDRVLVVDEDPGTSATSAVARMDFQRLVTEIGLITSVSSWASRCPA